MAKRALAHVPGTKPIVIGAFTFTETGMEVRGRPTFEEYEGVGEFVTRTHKASGWWLADWLRYGDSRADWQERLSQAQHVTGLSDKTLMNVRSIGAIAPSARYANVEFALHAEVARLPETDQQFWLARAEQEGWSRQELRQMLRADKRRAVLHDQATLTGKYRVIYADPPWEYRQKNATEDGSLRKQDETFPGMSIEDICNLPVRAHVLPNAVLFLWATVPFLLANPGPRDVIEAWGFDYKSNWTWHKVLGNPGAYSHVVHEHLLIATRGMGVPDAPTGLPDSLLTVRRRGEHSEKPVEVRRLIERHWTIGPYLELFGRARVKGWDVFGNDPRLWEPTS